MYFNQCGCISSLLLSVRELILACKLGTFGAKTSTSLPRSKISTALHVRWLEFSNRGSHFIEERGGDRIKYHLAWAGLAEGEEVLCAIDGDT